MFRYTHINVLKNNYCLYNYIVILIIISDSAQQMNIACVCSFIRLSLLVINNFNNRQDTHMESSYRLWQCIFACRRFKQTPSWYGIEHKVIRTCSHIDESFGTTDKVMTFSTRLVVTVVHCTTRDLSLDSNTVIWNWPQMSNKK